LEEFGKILQKKSSSISNKSLTKIWKDLKENMRDSSKRLMNSELRAVKKRTFKSKLKKTISYQTGCHPCTKSRFLRISTTHLKIKAFCKKGKGQRNMNHFRIVQLFKELL